MVMCTTIALGLKYYVLLLLSVVLSEMITLQYQRVLSKIGPEIVLLFYSGVGVGVGVGGGGGGGGGVVVRDTTFIGVGGWLGNKICTAMGVSTQCPFFLLVKVGMDERQNILK